MVGEQRLAERRRVRRLQASDLERLAGVVGPEHVVDDQHLVIVQGADPDALAAASREAVRPVERSRPQLVAVEVARAHVQQRGAELVLARVAVLFDEPDLSQRLQDPEYGPLREAELTGQLGHAES